MRFPLPPTLLIRKIVVPRRTTYRATMGTEERRTIAAAAATIQFDMPPETVCEHNYVAQVGWKGGERYFCSK